jgi:hypothetical protein
LVPQVDKLEQVALTWRERATALEITDQVTYDLGVRMLGDVTAHEKKIIDHHAPVKAATHNAWKEACAAEKKLLEPVQWAKQIIRRAIAMWDEKQEHLRREQEGLAIEAALRQEEELRQAMAKQAAELGASQETVEEIKTTPLPLPRPVVGPTFERARGISTRVTYRAEVVDLRALCRAIADGKVSSEMVMPNQSALNKRASAEKETMNIPGVRIVRDTGIQDRRRQ